MGIRLQHGEMNIVYMGQRYYEDFFFCLVAQLIVHDVLFKYRSWWSYFPDLQF